MPRCHGGGIEPEVIGKAKTYVPPKGGCVCGGRATLKPAKIRRLGGLAPCPEWLGEREKESLLLSWGDKGMMRASMTFADGAKRVPQMVFSNRGNDVQYELAPFQAACPVYFIYWGYLFLQTCPA